MQVRRDYRVLRSRYQGYFEGLILDSMLLQALVACRDDTSPVCKVLEVQSTEPEGGSARVKMIQ